MWFIHTMKYHSAITGNKTLIHAARWMDFKHMLRGQNPDVGDGRHRVCVSPHLGCSQGAGGRSPVDRLTGEALDRAMGHFLFFAIILLFFFFFILTLFFSFFPLQPIACGIPVHEPEIRPEPLRQEHWIRTAGVTENFRSQGMSVTVWCPGSPRCNAKTQLCPTSHRSHSWSPQARQLTRQEHSPSHPKQRDDKNYVTDERVR